VPGALQDDDCHVRRDQPHLPCRQRPFAFSPPIASFACESFANLGRLLIRNEISPARAEKRDSGRILRCSCPRCDHLMLREWHLCDLGAPLNCMRQRDKDTVGTSCASIGMSTQVEYRSGWQLVTLPSAAQVVRWRLSAVVTEPAAAEVCLLRVCDNFAVLLTVLHHWSIVEEMAPSHAVVAARHLAVRSGI
jgi:hypothetical protein